jgi:O-antigen ligase
VTGRPVEFAQPLRERARIAWAFAGVAVFVWPWINPYAGGPSPSVQPWLVSAACMVLAFACHPPGRVNAALAAATAGLVAWALLRTGAAPDPVALAGACALVLIACATAAGNTRREWFLDTVAIAWLLAAAISTAIGLLQYLGASEGLGPWVNPAAAGEAFANLRQRNQFASLTMFGLASLLWLYPNRLNGWQAAAAAAWLAAGNAATTSRTGLLQLLVLGVLIGVWPGAKRQRLFIWTAGLLAYVAAALALPAILEFVTGVAGNRLWDRVAAADACSSRAVLWSNVLELIRAKPWAGWGWGELDYVHYAHSYAGARFCDILDNAHNFALHLAVELGVPIALAICGAGLWALIRARPWAEPEPSRQMAWAVVAVMAVHSLLEYPLWYGPFQIALGLCLGLLWPGRAGAGTRARTVAVAVCAALACVYAAWDYRRVSQIYLPPEARMPAYRDDPLPLIRSSWLFRHQALFAELTINPLTRENAARTLETSLALLHYSPEPRVIEKVIESATMLGRDDLAMEHLARFRAAFPAEYAQWQAKLGHGTR